MKKSIIFHYSILNTGGAEMSALRLMRALSDQGWDVTLVLTTGGGPLEVQADPRLRLVPLRPASYGQRFLKARGVLECLVALPDLAAYCLAAAVGMARMIPLRLRRYDAAAVLLHGTSTWLVRRIVRANVRLQWVRNDLKHVDPSGSIAESIRRASPEIDHYICVSEVARQSLIAAVPEVAAKARVIYNVLDIDTMRTSAQQGPSPYPPRRPGILRVLTVCRLSEQSKGLRRMARVCRRLVDEGLDFEWFVVGDGQDRNLLEQDVQAMGLVDHMVLLGAMQNPFPAYLDCDMVAVLSNYEGLCGVVNEAKALGRPVIMTRVSGAEEQIEDEATGLIVGNEEDEIFDGMYRLMSDSALRVRLSNDYLPPALIDDAAKITELEGLFLGGSLPDRNR